MTRDQFNEVDTWRELFEVCDFTGCDVCEDIVPEEVFNEWIDDNVVSWAHEETWQDLLQRLRDLEGNTGYDNYVWDDYYSEYRPADDDDFNNCKDAVLDYLEREGFFDEEEEDEEEESLSEPVDPEDADPTPEEDMSLGEMFQAGVGCIRTIKEEALENARQQDKAFAEFANCW